MSRQITQIAGIAAPDGYTTGTVVALCDDGTVWRIDQDSLDGWKCFDSIPQEEDEDDI